MTPIVLSDTPFRGIAEFLGPIRPAFLRNVMITYWAKTR